jgi:chromosome segregation ATPase
VPRTCGACSHPAHEAIDRAIAEGDSLRAVADRFGVSDDSLSRHRAHAAPSPGAVAVAERPSRDELEAERRNLAVAAHLGDQAARQRVAKIRAELLALEEEAELAELASAEQAKHAAEARRQQQAEERRQLEAHRDAQAAAWRAGVAEAERLAGELQAVFVGLRPVCLDLDATVQQLEGSPLIVRYGQRARTQVYEALAAAANAADFRLVS